LLQIIKLKGSFGTEKWGVVVSEGEMLVMFVTLNSEDPPRNISERHKIE
jgi:hypothetical protein